MTNRYTKTAIILHWLIALGIFAMFGIGWYMADLPKEGAKQLAYDIFDWGVYTWQLSEEAPQEHSTLIYTNPLVSPYLRLS